MKNIEDRYWIETDSFLHSSKPDKSDPRHGIKGTCFPYVHAPHAQNSHNPGLSRFHIFPHAQTFRSKREPLYATQ